jgi:RimJ/RimL family protein N-acetyltransferase
MELVTERMRLRPPTVADAGDAFALLQDPDVVRWNPAPTVVDQASAIKWCQSGADWSRGDHATWHGVDATSGGLIVNVSIFAIDSDHASAKVGYRVVPWRRRQGYAREALIAVTAWAFADLQLERMQLEHSIENPASCSVALGAGYRFEGTLRAAYRSPDGERHDEHVHGRLSSDRFPGTADG